MKAIRALKRFISNSIKSPRIVLDETNIPPLLFARRTYNTIHPDYAPELVRNFPDKILNNNCPIDNDVYLQLSALIGKRSYIPPARWRDIMQQSLDEAKSMPHAEQIFNGVDKHELENGLFLYWTVRHLNPNKVAQIGFRNSFSSALIALALAKNGIDGILHLINVPETFDASNNPPVKSWVIPDTYLDRILMITATAHEVLPALFKQLDPIDLFYHDANQTYDQMMFSFIEAKKILNSRGIIASKNIATNASLWDFADLHMVPAYNHRGAIGIACF